jgi:hypothetical protein
MMKDDFTKNAARAIVLILVLLALDRLPALALRVPHLAQAAYIVDRMHDGNLNAEDYHALAAGYYEGLEQVDRISKDRVENDDYHLRDDFLRFEFKPNLHRKTEFAGMRITNSFGMPSPEITVEKPAHTRRIAWLGDSVSAGPYGYSYETLLTDKLNQADLTPETQQFQLLNFSVPGYVLLNKMDVGLEKAPQFHPDVYVVQLGATEIGGSRKHVAKMLLRGTDLKYDFLRQITAKAGIKSSDNQQTIIVKLQSFFIPMTRMALEQIRDHAAAQGARMIIVLVPAAADANAAAEDFDNMHPGVDGLGVPVIDLRDTFRNANLRELQVIPDWDIHPNIKGHQMIFQDLYAKLRANPDAWAALTGTKVESVAPSR